MASFPPECERVIAVNDGTGYGRNVNLGLRLATGDYIAIVNNDCRLADGDVSDLCVPETVTSPLIIGERQGFGESIEPGGFHGCFWVVPRPVLDRVGLLDERFEWGYWEDDDYIARLHEAGIPTRQVPSVRVKHVGGLTTVKVPEHRVWLERNEQVFKECQGHPKSAPLSAAEKCTTWRRVDSRTRFSQVVRRAPDGLEGRADRQKRVDLRESALQNASAAQVEERSDGA